MRHHLTPGKRRTTALIALSALLAIAGCEAPLGEEDQASSESEVSASPVGTTLQTTSEVNQRSGPGTTTTILQVIPAWTTVRSGSGYARKDTSGGSWLGVTWNGKTGWVDARYLERGSAAVGTGGSNMVSGDVSAKGQTQMRAVKAYAESHNGGASRGQCFNYVWRYVTSSGYGLLNEHGDAADMESGEARNFAEYMNLKANADLWDLRRLPITNPYDAPVGAVVVVAAGSPGTSHPTAGDIAIAAGNGRFINDGPNMSYGSKATFLARGGKLLGAYVPR